MESVVEWGAARALLGADQGLALMRFDGVMPLSRAHDAAGAYADLVRSSSAAAGVVDYRFANSDQSLRSFRKPIREVARRRQVHGVPAALVVRRDELTAWAEHARRLSESGLLRAVFTEPEAARRWAAEMAALYAAQARFRQRGR